MYIFTDLIAQSYLKYTKEKDDNIAVYFFQQYHLVNYEGKFLFTKSLFYNDLIKKLDGFIEGAFHNTHFIRRDHYYDNSIIEAEVFEEFQKKRLLEHQNLIDDSGIDYKVKRVNYEESINAKELIEAFDYGLDLKDPVKIITPSETIQSGDLVLRKSKLEYLRNEPVRARDAENLNELENSTLVENNLSNNSTSENETKVRKAFEFTLKEGKNKKQIISNEDHLRLIKWVTFYFDNNYELPSVDTSISELNIGKTYIRYAFKLLIKDLHKTYPIPPSFYTLVTMCFEDLKGDKVLDIQKTSMPIKWGKTTS